MPQRKFENETLFYCRACCKASDKELWERMWMENAHDMRMCPECGGIYDVSVANVVDEPAIDEGRMVEAMTEPPKPAAKKPAAKK